MTDESGHLHMTLRLPDRTGAAKMALAFARALRDEGFGLTLIHGAVPVAEPTIVPDFEGIGARTVLEPRLERPWDPRLVPALARRVRQERGLAVIGVNQRDRVPALLTAARVGVPGILMVQNQHRFHGPRPVAAVKRRTYATVAARHTAVAVCTSTVVRDEMTSFGLPRERTVVLPNGIDVQPPARLRPEERDRLRAEMGARPDDFLLLNVGRLDPQKGQDLLLAAMGGPDHARPVHLALVGSTGDSVTSQTAAYAASLYRQVDEIGLAGVVSFLGWRDDVDRLLAAADGYVHAARWEGLPLAVLEAMAAGCPTVFTDCSGILPGFVERRHGLMAHSGSVSSLRQCIDDLLAMSDAERTALGAQGAALIRADYRVQDLGRRFARLVRDATERGPAR